MCKGLEKKRKGFNFVSMKSTLQSRIIGQVTIGTVLFTALPLLLVNGDVPQYILYRFWVTSIGIIILIPLNLGYFFPQYYAKGKVGIYTILSFLTIFSIGIAFNSLAFVKEHSESIMPLIIKNKPYAKFFFKLLGISVPLIIVWLSSTLYEITILSHQVSKETIQLKSEKLESELKFLKSQINPHFLFNALNNIYTLTVLQPKAAGNSLLKLSEMLRYLLYECDAESVPLGRELTYLKNYIDLFTLKDEETLNIKLDTSDIDETVMIAPLLFVPFIENAFKHSHIEDLKNGWINATLLGDQTQVYFEIKNSLPEIVFAKDSVGGIGLQNVRRQLALIYPDKHRLNVTSADGVFSVELTIFL